MSDLTEWVCVSDRDSVRAAARQGEMMNDLFSFPQEWWSVPRAMMMDEGCTVNRSTQIERLRLGLHSFPSKNSQKPGLLAVIRPQACEGRYRGARVANAGR